jgi:hypothetical protein
MNVEASLISKMGGLVFLAFGIILAGIVGGFVPIAFVDFAGSLIALALAWIRNGAAFSMESYIHDYGLFQGPDIAIIPISSPFCLIVGSLFLAINRQTGFAKYVSGAATGAISVCVPGTLLTVLVPSSDGPMGLSDVILQAFFMLVSGAIGAIIFLAVVQVFDVNGKLFKRLKNKTETPMTFTNVGPPQ